MDSTLVVIGKMLLAAVLGGMIGLERLWHGRPAGLRTNMIIALSSCLFTVISFTGFPGSTEPERVAAQIVVGVGFLGAGTMFHQQKHVLGLTTASIIWLVAAIGMAVGVGMYVVAVAVTAMALGFLCFLAPLSNWLEREAEKGARRRGYRIVHEHPPVHLVSYPHKHAHRRRKQAPYQDDDESIAKD
jgi:putative Mg2+ transporter-C (MgtC) family protein